MCEGEVPVALFIPLDYLLPPGMKGVGFLPGSRACCNAVFFMGSSVFCRGQ